MEDALQPCIEVTGGRSAGHLFPLHPGLFVIGRLPGVEIFIDDAGVSRRHVKLTVREDGSIEASDLRSTNGMFVNGLRVERISLDDGDVISLGPDAALRLVHQCEGKLTTPPLAPARAPAPPARASASASANMAAAQALDEDDTDEPTESVPLGSEVSTGTFKRKQPAKDALPLSARQLEVSRLVAEGLTNAAIAERLGISPRTVTSHLDHIYGRLGIGSRAALTRMIVERGLTE